MRREPVRELTNYDDINNFRSFFSTIVGVTRVDEVQTTQMFNWNNNIFPMNKEWTKSCASCRGRVYTRLLGYYNSLPPIEVEIPKVEINELEVKKTIKK